MFSYWHWNIHATDKMNRPGKCSNCFISTERCPCSLSLQTSPPGPPKLKMDRAIWQPVEAEIPHTAKKIYRHTFTKELWDLNLGLSQNTTNQSILDILFNTQPPCNIPRKRHSVCWIYYSFTKWVFWQYFFLWITTLVFGAACEAESQGPWPLCLQLCCHFSCCLCRSYGNSPKCTNTHFCLLRTVFFTLLQLKVCQGLHLDFIYKMHNYKNLLQTQLPIHNCTYRQRKHTWFIVF